MGRVKGGLQVTFDETSSRLNSCEFCEGFSVSLSRKSQSLTKEEEEKKRFGNRGLYVVTLTSALRVGVKHKNRKIE